MLTKTLIAAVDCDLYDIEASLRELSELCLANELESIIQVTQKRDKPDNKYYFGEGKLAEIKELCENHEVEVVVIDDELSPSQIKNMTDFLDIEVIDRTMLVLEIFSNRATTSEGKLQTELALLKYRLPRLRGIGASMSRQGGGAGGAAGARRGGGETKLELNQRHIQNRISLIKEKLLEVEKRREMINTQRKKNDVPIIALTGYTNVGKSSLLNKLTNSDILEKDMLFATLDPTARKLMLPSGQNCIIVDTVGFISRLPHKLIEAFKSTLEQAKHADVILNVCDIASEDRDEQLLITQKTLDEIGCVSENIITVYNKCDIPHEELFIENSIKTSTRTGEGLDRLLEIIDEKLSDRIIEFTVNLPYDKANLASTIRLNGHIYEEVYNADCITIKGNIDKKLFYMLEMYCI